MKIKWTGIFHKREPEKAPTVSEVLFSDDITAVLDELYRNREKITGIAFIYFDETGTNWRIRSMTNGELLFAMEAVKNSVFNGEE